MMAPLRIVSTTVKETDGRGLWHVAWQRDGNRDEFVSVFTESTYLEQIAPRLDEPWTREEIFALRDS